MLRIGMQAPEFEIRTHTGLRFRLSDHRHQTNIVLFFFPSHNVWRGKKEVDAFAHHLSELRQFNALSVGISNAPRKDLITLAEGLGVPVLLGADEDLAVCRNYRVLWLHSVGIRRVTYVIDKTGTIRGIAHHELLIERHWTHVRRILTQLDDEERIAAYNRKAMDL